MINNSDLPQDSLSDQENSSYPSQDMLSNEMMASYYPPNNIEFPSFQAYYPVISLDQYQNPIYQLIPYYQCTDLFSFFPYQVDQVPYFDRENDQRTSYVSNFPFASDYTSKESVIEAFPHLEGFNNPDFDLESVSPDAHFYVLRSSNDDNIHKAIKYHLWTSTENGKFLLKKAWQEFEDARVAPEIYFIFTVINSNQFLGVAKMISNVNADETFQYWWEPSKWFGSFQIKWLFIKDIDYSNFEEIREENNLTRMANLKDGTKLNGETGKEILNIFKNFPEEPNIFASFEYMDTREDHIRYQRDNEIQYQPFMEPYTQAQYPSSPEKNQYPKKPTKRESNASGNKKFNNTYVKNNFNHSSPRSQYRFYKTYERKDQQNELESSPPEKYETKQYKELGPRKYRGPNYRRKNFNRYDSDKSSSGYYDKGE